MGCKKWHDDRALKTKKGTAAAANGAALSSAYNANQYLRAKFALSQSNLKCPAHAKCKILLKYLKWNKSYLSLNLNPFNSISYCC